VLQSDHWRNSVNRAMKAEEKQGFIDTGAVGGFSSFLLDSLAGLGGFFSAESLASMQRIAEEYHEVSPYKRRALLRELQELLDKTTSSNAPGLASGGIYGITSKETSGSFRTTEKVLSNLKVQTASISQPQNLQYIKGVGPQRAKQLENMGVFTPEDLLRYYPRKYEIRLKRQIQDIQDGEYVTIDGIVTGSQVTKGRVKVVKLNIEQDGRSIHAVWFNQMHIPKQYPDGTKVTVTGKAQWRTRIPELLVSEIRKGLYEGPDQKMVPVYSETARLNSKTIREIIQVILPQADRIFDEFLPYEENDLLERRQAIKEIHFPRSAETLKKARERLVVEEILLLQLALSRLRSPGPQKEGLVLNQGGALVRKFVSGLPFRLTGAQQRVIREIFRDMGSIEKPMTRLLQGDVGSGKTVVAMAALLQAVGSGYQAAMMAPTEVLAQQHYESLQVAFEPLGVKVIFLVGNQSKPEREQILGQILSGKAQVVVGTQTLIQESVRFNALGLAITDEQHRFGVRQRTLLQDKGGNPHVLVMTATPIPRTLALTLYGDLQLSVLDELPIGRKPVITRKISDRSRSSMEKFLKQHVAAGRQIYVVCPLVEETEKSDFVSATQKADELSQTFEGSNVALLHGRMKGQEKEEIMQCFRRGEIDILVTTTVVEVGVNVPNASVMVVEGAERFGLAQLHQLRGRVGRGQEQSYCLLISNTRDSTRLNILCETEDGFRIAEEDLKIRGPGELLGLRQHGVPELKLTDLGTDGRLVEKAYQLLQKVLKDPQKYQKVYQEVNRLYPKEKIGVN